MQGNAEIYRRQPRIAEATALPMAAWTRSTADIPSTLIFVPDMGTAGAGYNPAIRLLVCPMAGSAIRSRVVGAGGSECGLLRS